MSLDLRLLDLGYNGKGLQSGVRNSAEAGSDNNLKGVQLGWDNKVLGRSTGLQVGAQNSAIGASVGLQGGVTNYAQYSLDVGQVGLVNRLDSSSKYDSVGLQTGLANILLHPGTIGEQPGPKSAVLQIGGCNLLQSDPPYEGSSKNEYTVQVGGTCIARGEYKDEGHFKGLQLGVYCQAEGGTYLQIGLVTARKTPEGTKVSPLIGFHKD